MSNPKQSKNHLDLSWTTAKELKFIDELGLGAFARHKDRISMSRFELLERYIQASSRRRFWGDVDSSQVLKYANAAYQAELVRESQ